MSGPNTGSPAFDAAIREIERLHEEGRKISTYLTECSVKGQIKQNRELIRLRAINADLVAIAKRWAALDGGSWHERYARAMDELRQDTAAVIAKAKGEDK